MKAEIVSSGTEILLGEIIDTDSGYIAGRLPLLGIDLYWISHVGDNRTRLLEVLQRAYERSDIVIITGGLGPTEDDITRETLADLLHEKMHVDAELEQWLKRVFQNTGRVMAERNIKQAMLIPSARAIPNAQGTAPGWWIERAGKIILALPGPPSEMRLMWDKEIEPELRKKSESVILSRTLKTFGVSEALVDEMLDELLSSANPTVDVSARADGVQVRITAKAGKKKEAEDMIRGFEKRAHTILGDSIWGYDNDTLETVIANKLKIRKLSLAVMETTTGGLLASTLTDVPENELFFNGGLIVSSLEAADNFSQDTRTIKEYGIYSAEGAAFMAKAAQALFKSNIGLGLTVAPEQKVSGVNNIYIHISCGERQIADKAIWPPRRLNIKQRSIITALFTLNRFLDNC